MLKKALIEKGYNYYYYWKNWVIRKFMNDKVASCRTLHRVSVSLKVRRRFHVQMAHPDALHRMFRQEADAAFVKRHIGDAAAEADPCRTSRQFDTLRDSGHVKWQTHAELFG